MGRPTTPPAVPTLTRRDLLRGRLGPQPTGAVQPAGTLSSAGEEPVTLPPGALRRQSRAEVQAALARIRARRRQP